MSNEPLRRTGSYAAATITAALAIWAATGSSNVLQSLFLSLSYVLYRALRGHRWLTVHRKQLYQRLPPPPPPLVQHQQSPAPTSCRPRLLPLRPSTVPLLAAPSSEKVTGPCRTACQVHPSNKGTAIAFECKRSSSKLHRQLGTSWPLEQRRCRRRRLNALRSRRRRRRRRSSTRPSRKRLRRDVNNAPRCPTTTASVACVNVPMRPTLPPLPPPHPPCRRHLRRPRHLSRCWCLLARATTHRTTHRRAAVVAAAAAAAVPPPPTRAWSRTTITVNRYRRVDVTGVAKPGNPWRATVVPPETDASVDS